MSTKFFDKLRQKSLPAPPVSLPPREGRERFTTEEYMNSLYVPVSTPVSMGVRFGETSMFSTGLAQAHLITQQVQVNGRLETVQHVVLDGGVGK